MRSLLKDREKSFPKVKGPHLLSQALSAKIAWGFFFALIPVLGTFIFSYGIRSAVSFLTASFLSCALQYLAGKRTWAQIGRAAFIGGLLSLILPQSVSLGNLLIAALIATLLGYLAFGGLGQTIFHPVFVGYFGLFFLRPWHFKMPDLDAVSFSALLISIIFMRYKKWIFLRPVLVYLFVLGAFSVLSNNFNELIYNPLFLVVFFVLTDSVFMPVSRKARIAFSVLAAILTASFRVHMDYFQAALGSVFLLSAYVPILDRWADGKLNRRRK